MASYVVDHGWSYMKEEWRWKAWPSRRRPADVADPMESKNENPAKTMKRRYWAVELTYEKNIVLKRIPHEEWRCYTKLTLQQDPAMAW